MFPFTCLFFALTFGGESLLTANEPIQQPTAAQILARWQAAASTTERLDTTLTRLIYDHTFKETKVAIGRLYMERSGRCHLRLEPPEKLPVSTRQDASGRPYSTKADVARTFIWRPEEFLVIDPIRKESTIYSTKAAAADEHDDTTSGGFFQFFAKAMRPFESAAFCKALDEEFLSEFTERFDVSVSHQNDISIISARPKDNRDARNFKLLKLAFARSSAFPTAMSTLDPAGTKEDVFVFGHPILNVVPRNANQLFEPDFEGFHVWVSEPASDGK